MLKSYSRAFVALLLLLCLSSILILNCSSLLRTFVFALYFSLRCSIFNDRFARLSPRSPPPLSRRPCYYITPFFPCQYLFQNFFKFFLSSFQVLSGATALVFYHFIFILSSVFLKFLHFCALLYIYCQLSHTFISFSTASAIIHCKVPLL